VDPYPDLGPKEGNNEEYFKELNMFSLEALFRSPSWKYMKKNQQFYF
jgi:hypothetical protein